MCVYVCVLCVCVFDITSHHWFIVNLQSMKILMPFLYVLPTSHSSLIFYLNSLLHLSCIASKLAISRFPLPPASRVFSSSSSFFLRNSFIIYLFIYFWLCWVFVSVRGLFSSCGKRGPLFIAVRGPLTIAASLVAEHKLQTRRLSSCGSRA